MVCVVAGMPFLLWIFPAPTNLPRVRVMCTHSCFSSLVFLRLRIFPVAQDAFTEVKDIAVDSVTKDSTLSMLEQDSRNTADDDARKRGRGDQHKAGFAFSPQHPPHMLVHDLCDSPHKKRQCSVTWMRKQPSGNFWAENAKEWRMCFSG